MVKKDSKYRSGITAKEFTDELMKNPEYIERIKEHERWKEENLARYQEAARGVLADLAIAGFYVQSVGELVDQFARDKVPYVDAIPILIKWLPLVNYDNLKDDIVGTLSVPWAKPLAVRPLLEEYVKIKKTGNAPTCRVRWAIGNALEVLADDSVFKDIVRIAEDRRYGRDREMVVMALGKMKNPKAVKVLIGLLDDEDVNGHAVIALGKLKVREALPLLEPFLQHPKTWIRNEAKRAIKKIEQGKGR
jgi:hypothetical protein